jgi:hypothetical protein
MKFAKLLEMRSFFSPHIILGVGKQQDLRNQICQTVGDALRHPRDEIDGGLLPMLFFLLLFLWLDCKFWKTISRDILCKHAGNASVIWRF